MLFQFIPFVHQPDIIVHTQCQYNCDTAQTQSAVNLNSQVKTTNDVKILQTNKITFLAVCNHIFNLLTSKFSKYANGTKTKNNFLSNFSQNGNAFNLIMFRKAKKESEVTQTVCQYYYYIGEFLLFTLTRLSVYYISGCVFLHIITVACLFSCQ